MELKRVISVEALKSDQKARENDERMKNFELKFQEILDKMYSTKQDDFSLETWFGNDSIHEFDSDYPIRKRSKLEGLATKLTSDSLYQMKLVC